MSRWWAAAGLAALLLAGCAGAPAGVSFPKSGAVAGWSQGQHETLTGDALAGFADSAEQYAVEAVERQGYSMATGAQLEVQAWRMADAGEAFGLWSALRSGEPADVGNNADSDGTRRLGFWQGRYFVQALAAQDSAAQELEAFGAAMAKALPAGGSPPGLIADLPRVGLEADSLVYFHLAASVQKTLDLGGQDSLGLSLETKCALASYTLDGQPYQLLLIVYPQEEQAAGYAPVLQNLGLAGLLVSGSQGARLGAVFGAQSSDTVVNLLSEALK